MPTLLQFVLLLFPIPFLWILASHAGFLMPLEGVALKWRYNFRGEIDAPVKLIYVNIDAQAVKLMGERPFPRFLYAEAVKALFQYGKARVVGVDIVFSDSAQSFLTDPEKVLVDNAALRKVIEEYPHLVLAAAYTQSVNELSSSEKTEYAQFPLIYEGFTDPEKNALPEQPGISLLGFKERNIALINIDEGLSAGGFPQWVPVFAKTPGPTYLTMALELARVYHRLPKESVHIYEDRVDLIDLSGKALFSVPLTKKQLVEINWASKFYSSKNNHVSMETVLVALAAMEKGDAAQKERAALFFKRFERAIVLIGPVDPLLQDLAPTPYDSSPVPKVSVHGNLLKTFFLNDYVDRLPQKVNDAFTLILTVLVAGLGVYGGRYKKSAKAASVLVLGGYIAAVFAFFNAGAIIIPLIVPVGSALSTTFIGVLYGLLLEEQQKSRIKNLFGTYVSPEVVHQMVESHEEPHLGGAEEDISAFFSDIQSFSSFSEVLSPQKLVELMNDYLTVMTDIIQQEEGTLDKYIGDAIVAMFGAPIKTRDHAMRACWSAYRIQKEQIALRKRWQEEGKWPALVFEMHTRIGINTGNAIVGNMGSRTRFNYTMMGDTVNLAARCESGAKSYGIYTMVTENTKEAAQKIADTLAFRFIDKIIVKGRNRPVGVYEIVDTKEDLPREALQCIQKYERGFELYLNQQWNEATACFEESAQLERFQPGRDPGIIVNPSLVFIERCRLMKESPPVGNWNGVFRMTNK